MQNNAGMAKEKLPISRILSNYVYLLKYAFGKDAGLILMIFFSFISAGVGYACMDTVFMRAFINYLSDDSYSFHQTAVLVAGATIGMAFLMAVERCTESFAQPRIIRMSGMMQEEMIKKAVTMDLICYDCDTYYDDFVVAASQLEDMVITAVFDLARMGRNVATVLVLSGLITVIDPVIAIFPVLGFLVNMFSRFRIMKLEYDYDVEKKKIMRRANYSKRVFYQPEYAKEIKLSHIEVPLEKQFHQAIDETIAVSKKYGVRISLWSLVNWITVFTFLSMFCVPLYLGYMALVACSIGLGDVAALNKAQSTMRNQLDSVNYCVERIQRAGLFCERFRKFMNYESKIEKAQGTVQVPKSQSVLEIKDMSFRYDGAKEDTLKHINMKIQAGQKVAFVGENGAGKSTFIKLLMRLYDVTEGSICYGGHDIREYSTDCLLYTSLTREFAEDGVQLSGGEAQKVAIARLFAKKERMHIAILDEPSSALDPKAEYELNQNILNKAEDATVIFISHRLSTTRDADRIYMFENGEIIEQGTHQELMGKNGQYAEMFCCQAKYYQQNQEIIC